LELEPVKGKAILHVSPIHRIAYSRRQLTDRWLQPDRVQAYIITGEPTLWTIIFYNLGRLRSFIEQLSNSGKVLVNFLEHRLYGPHYTANTKIYVKGCKMNGSSVNSSSHGYRYQFYF